MSAVLPNANFTHAIVVKTASKVFAPTTWSSKGFVKAAKWSPPATKAKTINQLRLLGRLGIFQMAVITAFVWTEPAWPKKYQLLSEKQSILPLETVHGVFLVLRSQRNWQQHGKYWQLVTVQRTHKNVQLFFCHESNQEKRISPSGEANEGTAFITGLVTWQPMQQGSIAWWVKLTQKELTKYSLAALIKEKGIIFYWSLFFILHPLAEQAHAVI